MISTWRYIDPTLVTQRLTGDEQAANELDMFAEQHEISTPRSGTPDTICGPDAHPPFALTNTGHASSDSEAAAWEMVTSLEVNSLPTTTSPSVSAAATSIGQPLEAPSLFHIQTRLADG